MTDVKALRALLDDAIEGGMTLPAFETKDVTEYENSSEDGLVVTAVNALPDLLALAEAVRELAGPIAMLVEHGSLEERDAARRVTAILDPTNAGDGR